MLRRKSWPFFYSFQLGISFFLGVGLLLNLFFLLCMQSEYHAITLAHGNVAFNLYRYNIPGINTKLAESMHTLQAGKSVLIDFDAVRDKICGPPDVPFPVNDTIGYGVLLGLLWKLTHTLRFSDIIFLQILIYLCMVYLIYQTGLLLFVHERTARYATVAFLCYLPLIALNVHAVRDVWAAYGLIVLMYSIVQYIDPSTSLRANGEGAFCLREHGIKSPRAPISVTSEDKESGTFDRHCEELATKQSSRESNRFFTLLTGLPRMLSASLFELRRAACMLAMTISSIILAKDFLVLLLGCMFFALCQWIRPTLFLASAIAIGMLGVCSFIKTQKADRKKTTITIITLAFTNLCIFWLPFMTYNYQQYGRYLVSPAGQDMLEGLGEFSNPWGHKLSDEYVAALIQTKYGSKYGTPQFDDDAKQEFLQAYQEHPSAFWVNIIKRLPMLILPAMPWLFYEVSPYAHCIGAGAKIWYLLTHPFLWPDFFMRHLYIRLYIILGYVGLVFLLWRRQYGVALLICAVLLSSVAKLPSHIEYRYLTPYYWVLCFAIGYLFDRENALIYKKSRD